jgi:hypothetical protein
MTTTSEVRSVAVPGGDLAYEVLSGSTEPVLAIHGISSHRRLWSWLHVEAPDLTWSRRTCAVARTASTSRVPPASPATPTT